MPAGNAVLKRLSAKQFSAAGPVVDDVGAGSDGG
jgi:hypothetical protein